MNVLCYFGEEGTLLLGIPHTVEWSIKAMPSDGGSVLTLQLEGDQNIPLFNGNPINLAGYTVEIKDFNTARLEISETELNVNITHPYSDIRYYEAVKLPGDVTEVEEKSEHRPSLCVDRTAHYKWCQILKYLEERLGAVTVASWFDDALVTELTADTLRIEVGSNFRYEIIQRRCVNLIQDALKELFSLDAKVEVYSV